MEYLVKEDDSLFGIALKFSVNHDYLMRLNDLSSDLIFPG
jgi:LysM repeat protein